MCDVRVIFATSVWRSLVDSYLRFEIHSEVLCVCMDCGRGCEIEMIIKF